MTVIDPELIQRRQDVEVARRCITAGTLATAWWRRRGDYVVHDFTRSVSAQCDRWVDAFVNQRPLFLSLHAPPGMGKSEHVGRAMPCRALALAPGRSIVYVTSVADRAVEVSLSVRAAVERLAPAFPHLAPHPSGPWTQTQWRTAGGGWWTSLAPGMATGGVDAHGLIFDDVTGSGATQASEAEKRRIRRFMEEDALSRMRGVGPRLNMETRRGLDDGTAHLQSLFGAQMEMRIWRHVAGQNEQDGRPPGAYMWPERYGPAWHAANPHLTPGSPVWEALHQQNPIMEGGEVLRSEWLDHRYEAAPRAMRSHADRGSVVAFVDTSSKTAQRNDPTGIVVMGRFGPKVRVLHAEEVRPHDLTGHLADLHAAWILDAVVEEDTSIAPEVKRSWDRLRAGGRQLPPMILQSVAGGGDKVARMEPHKIRWIAGDIELPAAAPWVAGYKAHMLAVPNGSHDDMWDATSLGLAYYATSVMPVATRGPLHGRRD